MSRADGELYLELWALQGNNEVITKGQLLERVRQQRYEVRDSNLTAWIGAGVLPKSARLGGRNVGVFPEITVDLACFVAVSRKVQLPFAAIHELWPLWRFLKGVLLHAPHVLDVADLEQVVREHVRSPKAVSALPWMVPAVIAEELARPRSNQLVIRDREGQLRRLGDGDPPIMSFIVCEPDTHDQRRAYRMRRLRVVLPTPGPESDRLAVVVGAPPGAEIVDRPRGEPASNDGRPAADHAATSTYVRGGDGTHSP